MKNITTKSINEKKTKTDGLRVCVMRRIHPEYDFDIWIPKLAPSEGLLQQYVINKTIKWSEFEKKYKKNVLKKNIKLIQLLITFSRSDKITLLCTEKSARFCHRSLIIEECRKELNRRKQGF